MIRFNLFTEELPKDVEISGRKYEINTDFKTGFKLEEVMRSSVSGETKILRMLQIYYPVIPPDIAAAVEKALWFYQCGDSRGTAEKPKNKKERYRKKYEKNTAAYSFCQDAAYIYASFLEQYRIDLCDIEYMHWWKFCAMFESLSEDTQMGKIMYYRKVRTTGMSKDKRFFINEMKKKYRLLDNTDVSGRLTLEQRNMRWRKYIKDRFKEQGR